MFLAMHYGMYHKVNDLCSKVFPRLEFTIINRIFSLSSVPHILWVSDLGLEQKVAFIYIFSIYHNTKVTLRTLRWRHRSILITKITK